MNTTIFETVSLFASSESGFISELTEKDGKNGIDTCVTLTSVNTGSDIGHRFDLDFPVPPLRVKMCENPF